MTAPQPVPPTPVPAPLVRRRRPDRRGLLVMAALAVGLALVVASCKQLDPANRAAPVPAMTNGNLPLSYLASAGSGCTVYDEALPSMKAMIEHAKGDGVTLRPSSCYRDYAGQVATRQDWCSRGACQMAATPGSSNHGWGKAVDFADQSGMLRFDGDAYRWLKTWAGVYGWLHPSSMDEGGSVPEPWHWEWVGDGGKMFVGEYFGIGNAVPAVPRGLPFGSLDEVTAGTGTVTVAGWAIDPDQVGSIPVHVYVDDAGAALTANLARPDVAAAFPLYAGAPHGYRAVLAAAPGPHQVCAYAINVAGTGWNVQLGCRTVTVGGAAAPAAVTATPPTTTAAPAPTTTAPAAGPTTTVAPVG